MPEEEKNQSPVLASSEELRGRKSGTGAHGKKNSRYLSFGIIGAFLVIAIAAYLLSSGLNRPEPVIEPAASSAPAGEMVKLMDYPRSEVLSVSVTPDSGTPYTILNQNKYDENGKALPLSSGERAYAVEGRDYFDLDQNRAEAIIGYAATLTANRLVTEHAEQLSDYGLDKPRARVEMRYAAQPSAVWLIGSKAPTSSASYMMKEGSDAVYLVYPSAIESLSGTLESLHVLGMPVQFDSKLIRSVLIEAKDRDPVELGYSEEGAADKGYSISALRLKQPFYYTANVERGSDILNGCAGLTVKAYAGELTDLADTGLEENAPRFRVTIQQARSQENLSETDTYVLRIGNFAGSDSVYIMTDDTQAVYLADADSVTFLDQAVPAYLVDQFSNLIYINAVTAVDIASQTKSWHLDLSQTTDAKGRSTYAYAFDGQPVKDEKQFRKLYQQLVGLTNSRISDDYAIDAPVLLSVKYTLNVEPYELPVEYLDYSEEYCAVRRDGLTLFLIKREQVTALMDALEQFRPDVSE